jgi:hypothetical protein
MNHHDIPKSEEGCNKINTESASPRISKAETLELTLGSLPIGPASSASPAAGWRPA